MKRGDSALAEHEQLTIDEEGELTYFLTSEHQVLLVLTIVFGFLEFLCWPCSAAAKSIFMKHFLSTPFICGFISAQFFSGVPRQSAPFASWTTACLFIFLPLHFIHCLSITGQRCPALFILTSYATSVPVSVPMILLLRPMWIDTLTGQYQQKSVCSDLLNLFLCSQPTAF